MAKSAQVRAGPARAKTRGVPQGRQGRSVEAKGTRRAPRLRGSLPSGRRTSASRVKRNSPKKVLSMLTCPGSIGSVSRLTFCSRKKALLVAYLFASLNSLAVTRTLVTSTGCTWGHKASQNVHAFCDSIFHKNSALRA